MDTVITRIVPVRLPNGTIMHVEAEPIGPVVVSASAPIESDVADRTFRPDHDEAVPFSEATREIDVADRSPMSQQDIKSVTGTIEGIAQAVTASAERSNAY